MHLLERWLLAHGRACTDGAKYYTVERSKIPPTVYNIQEGMGVVLRVIHESTMDNESSYGMCGNGFPGWPWNIKFRV